MKRDQTHSRVLADAARSLLGPLGVIQKGRSRLWLDDHGWWLVVVEFQPSSWAKGSYLNVGVMWLWWEKDHYSFDHDAGRLKQFVEYLDEAQFQREAVKLASCAREQVLKYRSEIRSIGDAAKLALKSTKTPWQMFHAAVACGCSGQTAPALSLFREISKLKPEPEWLKDLQVRAQELERLTTNTPEFRRTIEGVILRSRLALNLPQITTSGL